jgi:uncharacterized protein (DUF305 family)
MARRLVLTVLLAGLGLVVTAGCRSKGEPNRGDRAGDTRSATMADTGGTMAGDHMMMAHNDRDLATMLIEHHGGAIRLSDLELQRGQDADAKAMARKTRDQQAKERQDLQRLQQQLGGPGMSMSPEMKAKQAQAEQEVSAASGHDADHAFLKHMTEHHKDGIMMVQHSMPNLKNDELEQMADKMITDQQQDIEKMRKMMH